MEITLLILAGVSIAYALLVIVAGVFAFVHWVHGSEARENLCVALAVASLAVSCASPVHYSDSHSIWLESVKNGRW